MAGPLEKSDTNWDAVLSTVSSIKEGRKRMQSGGKLQRRSRRNKKEKYNRNNVEGKEKNSQPMWVAGLRRRQRTGWGGFLQKINRHRGADPCFWVGDLSQTKRVISPGLRTSLHRVPVVFPFTKGGRSSGA